MVKLEKKLCTFFRLKEKCVSIPNELFLSASIIMKIMQDIGILFSSYRAVLKFNTPIT